MAAGDDSASAAQRDGILDREKVAALLLYSFRAELSGTDSGRKQDHRRVAGRARAARRGTRRKHAAIERDCEEGGQHSEAYQLKAARLGRKPQALLDA